MIWSLLPGRVIACLLAVTGDHPYVTSGAILIGLGLLLSPYVLTALLALFLATGVPKLPAPVRNFLPAPVLQVKYIPLELGSSLDPIWSLVSWIATVCSLSCSIFIILYNRHKVIRCSRVSSVWKVLHAPSAFKEAWRRWDARKLHKSVQCPVNHPCRADHARICLHSMFVFGSQIEQQLSSFDSVVRGPIDELKAKAGVFGSEVSAKGTTLLSSTQESISKVKQIPISCSGWDHDRWSGHSLWSEIWVFICPTESPNGASFQIPITLWFKHSFCMQAQRWKGVGWTTGSWGQMWRDWDKIAEKRHRWQIGHNAKFVAFSYQ